MRPEKLKGYKLPLYILCLTPQREREGKGWQKKNGKYFTHSKVIKKVRKVREIWTF